MKRKILVTCPPMLKAIDRFRDRFDEADLELVCPDVVQIIPEKELCELVPQMDGWIIGDDPATQKVFEAGAAGKLCAAVKWGVGTDNVDIDAARKLGLAVVNTPGMFNDEVADVALGYVIALARETFVIDRGVRKGEWPKPAGISLRGKKAGVVGYGNIGRTVCSRLQAVGLSLSAYDPFVERGSTSSGIEIRRWPDSIGELDFLVLACALTESNTHLINENVINSFKDGLRLVNVARGPIVDEQALIKGLDSGKIHSVALDVFEKEPLEVSHALRKYEKCVFGSHNGSNTIDAVVRTSEQAIDLLIDQLNGSK